ncbi:MAG: PEGA domain-containing protein [Bryobacteraceae bacterium]
MDSSQYTYPALDELKYIQFETRQSRSLDDLRLYFERVQNLRRSHTDDFDLQVFIAEIQEQIIDRARLLREESAPLLVSEGSPAASDRLPSPARHEERTSPAEVPAEVHRLDAKSWQRSIYLALFLTFIVCAAAFYVIQAARKLNFPPEGVGAPQSSDATANGKNASTQTAANAPAASTKPTVRLYTDLVPGTVSIDGNAPQDLKDGELVLDNLDPGQHSLKISGRSGEAAFSYDVAEKLTPRVVGLPSASNTMAVLVSTHDGTARLVTNAEDSDVLLDGKPAGRVGPEGLALDNLGTTDHELQVTQGKDRQRFVLTYTQAPTLTAYIKSDPNAGTVVIIAGQDGADVYINGKLYRRKTEHGQIRIPNLNVGEYNVRVHKQGFIDPPPATVQIKKAEETAAEFHLQPVPEIATLEVKGALPGTMVYVDNELAAAIGADGLVNISNVKPGDHTVELRRDQALSKRFERTFHAGDVAVLSGPDVTLDKVVVENKPVPAPPAAEPIPDPALSNNSMQVDGQQIRKGGGFVPYHIPQVPGHYTFTAQVRKGGLFKHGKLQWYAAYEDNDNYVLFTLDGKHGTVREVRDGKATELNRISFSSDSNDWVQVDLAVRRNSINARVKLPDTAWNELGTVSSSGGDFTQGKVGFYLPGSDEIAVSNFRFSTH